MFPQSVSAVRVAPAIPANPPAPAARTWLACACALGISLSAHAFESGSTGADGVLAPAAGVGTVEIDLPESGILNYSSVQIPAGVTVRFKRNTLNTPVVLLVSGDASIAGTINVSGTHGAHVGTAGDGNVADDGVPGKGGPGGFDGGRGGAADQTQKPEVIRGGSGLGPGGGKGGIEGGANCALRYHPHIGGGAGFAGNGREDAHSAYYCGGGSFSDAVGRSYGNALLQPLIGGSGGGGGRGGANFAGSGGGGGGGALLIAVSGTLNHTGSILANGGGSGSAAGTNAGASGGGGSGGGVRLVATRVTGNGSISANGGCIFNGSTALANCESYGASVGRIRIEAPTITYSGASNPAYTTDTPGPVFLANLPSLRIASVAGAAVPAVPTGQADVVLPADVANPVTVTFETVNVPVGNTVLLKVVPANGNPIEVQSPAIAGSAAAGTASVQVNLPQGPSVLQATSTYTVVVAMGDALAPYAGQERVEKVEVVATLGAAPRARLITVSGRTFDVTWTVLQQAAWLGSAG